MGRDEKEKPALAGFVVLELEPKEKEGVLFVASVEVEDEGAAAGLPKLKVGRVEVEVEAEEGVEELDGAALEEVPLVADLMALAVPLKALTVFDDGAEDAEGDGIFFSIVSRCLRY